MKLPETVNIYGKEIPVKRKSMDDYGLTDGNTIWISSDCPRKHLRTTLIHEMIHCLFRRVSIIQTDINENVEEIIADTVAVMIDESFILRARK